MMLGNLFGTKQKSLEACKTSPGKLRLYQQCPLKYKLVHENGQKSDSTRSPHLAFDSILNGMLESCQRNFFARKEEISEESLIRELDRHWKPEEFQDSSEAHLYYDRARNAACNMASWFRSQSATLMQWQNKPAIGVFAPWYPRPLTIWTRLDRVDQMPDGTLRLIDFKSGAREISSDQMRMDLGIRIQSMAAREIFGQKLALTTLVFMQTGSVVETPCDQLDLDLLQADVHAIVRDIQMKRFEPHPGPLCSVCEFQPECRGWKKKLPWVRSGETRETYNRRLRLSYSKMSLFERCPRAYKALYHDRITPKPQPFFSFGSCIHAVMEEFYDPDSRERPTLDHMLRLLDDKWRFFRAGYRSPEEEQRYAGQARAMLETYFRHFVKDQKFRPAHAIEKFFELPVGEHAIMTGFIDRIDLDPDGIPTILDYKTEPTDRSQESVDKDLQLTLYYWATREFLGLDAQKLGLFMMSHDKIITTQRKPDDIPELIERVNATALRIIRETEFAPCINKYCLNCDHLTGCPLESRIRSDTTIRSMEFIEPDGITDIEGSES